MMATNDFFRISVRRLLALAVLVWFTKPRKGRDLRWALSRLHVKTDARRVSLSNS